MTWLPCIGYLDAYVHKPFAKPLPRSLWNEMVIAERKGIRELGSRNHGPIHSDTTPIPLDSLTQRDILDGLNTL